MTYPSNWNIHSVGELCLRITSGGTPKRSNPEYYEPGTVPWIKTADLKDTYIQQYSGYISETGLRESSAKLLPANTVLMAMYGATVGRLGILIEEAACNQAACALIADPAICDHRWLFYALLNDRDFIVSQATGAAQQNLSGRTIRQFEYATPPLKEQQTIAEVLGALDDKISANTHQARLAEELAGSIFDQAAALLPRQPLSAILTPILGGTPSRSTPEFWNGEGLWASAKDITGAPFSVVLDTEEKITSTAVEKTKAKPLPKGSVILTARGTVGAVARLAAPASFNQSCYGFLPEGLTPSLLYFSVLRATDQAKALVHGSVFDTITKRTFDHLLIPQFGDTANSLESQLSPLLDLVTACVHENKTLVATRDALLPQLMSGKLRVKDAEKVLEDVL